MHKILKTFDVRGQKFNRTEYDDDEEAYGVMIHGGVTIGSVEPKKFHGAIVGYTAYLHDKTLPGPNIHRSPDAAATAIAEAYLKARKDASSIVITDADLLLHKRHPRSMTL